MSAPSAKMRKRAAVHNLRQLVQGLGLAVSSIPADLTKAEFQKLHQKVLSACSRLPDTARAQELLQDYEGLGQRPPVSQPADVAQDGDVSMGLVVWIKAPDGQKKRQFGKGGLCLPRRASK